MIGYNRPQPKESHIPLCNVWYISAFTTVGPVAITRAYNASYTQAVLFCQLIKISVTGLWMLCEILLYLQCFVVIVSIEFYIVVFMIQGQSIKYFTYFRLVEI